MAKMTSRGWCDIIETRMYSRFTAPAALIYNDIVGELRHNEITCHASIEQGPTKYQKVQSDGHILFLSERGLFTLFVTICSVGNYSQVQIITRNVPRKYPFNDANTSMEHSMHSIYRKVVYSCIWNAINRLADANNWHLIGSESTELED